MLQRELAAEIQISQTKLQEAMLDSGIDPDLEPIDDATADRIRQIFQGFHPQSAALPESKQSPEPEQETTPKRKRGRPSKDSQLATKAADSIEQTGVTTHQVKLNHANQINTLEMMAGVAAGQQAAGAFAEGFLRARAAGQASFSASYTSSLLEAITTGQKDFNPAELAEKLRLDPSSDFLGVDELPLDLKMLEISYFN